MIFTRLSYNTLNWERPSGLVGKSKNIGVHENDYRFGFEEWIRSNDCFLIDKEEKKFHFGYIEGIHKNYKGDDENDRLILFTINCGTCQRFIVGEIKSWNFVTPEESLWIVNQYPQSIISMRDELVRATNNFQPAINKFNQHADSQNGFQLFNIKYNSMNYYFNSKNPINIDNGVQKLNRFWLYRR